MEKMVIRKHPIKKEVLFSVGAFSLVISIFLGRFSGHNPLIDFFAGLFTGLSLTLNLGFLFKWRIERNANIQSNNQI